MSLTTAFRDARDRLTSLALSTGYFEATAQHEPKNAPGRGLTLFVWLARVTPIQSSGLNSTSVRMDINVQLRCSMTREPQDDIDVDLLEAGDAMCAAINGDLRLGGSIRSVDVFGQHGVGMDALTGYIDQDGHKFRVLDITVPCLVNDAWTQAQ